MEFSAYAIEEPSAENREAAIAQLQLTDNRPNLVLNTCQRLEVYGFGNPEASGFPVAEQWSTVEAFERLTRIAAGLESRILGELEVMGQVRTAFKIFQEFGTSNLNNLDRTFQEIIALARKARRQSGIDANQTSLSGLACRNLLGRIPTGMPVAVIGSGTLATSVIRYLSKRGESPVRVSSRCPEKAIQLAVEAGGFGASLDDLSHLLEGAHGIIAATAAPHPVLYGHHLDDCSTDVHIVDLGVPQDCSDCLQDHDRVNYVALESIESEATGNLEARKEAAKQAEAIIRQGAIAWHRQA